MSPFKILQYWKKQIRDVEEELPTLFANKIDEPLSLLESVDDIDAIRLSAAYGIALRELRFLEHEIAPNQD